MQSTTKFTIQTSSMDTDICEFTNLLTDIHVHLSTHKMNKIKIQQKNKNKKNKKIEINTQQKSIHLISVSRQPNTPIKPNHHKYLILSENQIRTK